MSWDHYNYPSFEYPYLAQKPPNPNKVMCKRACHDLRNKKIDISVLEAELIDMMERLWRSFSFYGWMQVCEFRVA
jgi:hypothetical protein